MIAELRPVRIDTGSPDQDGALVFVADRLVAVLIRLSEQHGDQAGRWFLEHGFGRIGGPKPSTFDDLVSAERWILHHFQDA